MLDKLLTRLVLNIVDALIVGKRVTSLQTVPNLRVIKGTCTHMFYTLLCTAIRDAFLFCFDIYAIQALNFLSPLSLYLIALPFYFLHTHTLDVTIVERMVI